MNCYVLFHRGWKGNTLLQDVFSLLRMFRSVIFSLPKMENRKDQSIQVPSFSINMIKVGLQISAQTLNKKWPARSNISLVVLSDEHMSKRWQFSLLNDEQMSNKVRVEHQPVYSKTRWPLIPWYQDEWMNSDPVTENPWRWLWVVESSMFASNVSGSRLVQYLFQYHSIHPRVKDMICLRSQSKAHPGSTTDPFIMLFDVGLYLEMLPCARYWWQVKVKVGILKPRYDMSWTWKHTGVEKAFAFL